MVCVVRNFSNSSLKQRIKLDQEKFAPLILKAKPDSLFLSLPCRFKICPKLITSCRLNQIVVTFSAAQYTHLRLPGKLEHQFEVSTEKCRRDSPDSDGPDPLLSVNPVFRRFGGMD